MHQKRKYTQYRAFLDLQYPLLRFHQIVVQELKYLIVFWSLILFPEPNQERRYQVIVIFIKQQIPEYLRIVNIRNGLLFVHDMIHLSQGYFFIGEKEFEILLEDYVVYQVLVFYA